MKTLFQFILPVMLSLLAMDLTGQTTDTVYLDVEGAKLHTVLTLPSNGASMPLAIFIAGSGPTDLNGNQPMMLNNSLKLLSDALVSQNIATLRFDKRAIAKSALPNMNEADFTIDLFANDVIKLIDYAREKGFRSVFIIGHSEGSLIGLIALQKKKVNGFISLAGAGFPADVILKTQLKPQLPEDMYAKVEVLLDSLKAGHQVKSAPVSLSALFRPSVQPYLISWFTYDPAQLIKKIKCPTLIIQGDKDLQIKPEDARKLADALPSAQLIMISRMNHVLKTIQGDNQENYNAYSNPDLPLNGGLITTICEFINTQKP